MSEQKNPKQSEKNSATAYEEAVLKSWQKNNIFEKTLEKTKDGESFVFYDGPPFATGLPHYGHIVAGTIKDVIPRYQTMRGKHVRRQWGWDCHGLPVENLIEDQLGFKSKQDIEDFGIENFNQKARESVMIYDQEWRKVVPRLGRFVDMEHEYKTMDWQYSESIMWAFKELWDKDLIYKGYKSMHICPRCETTLSNNEVADGYKDIKDLTVTAKFEMEDEPGTFVLAWTTTPWTLPGNVALAVRENVEYVKAKTQDGTYIVAKERVEDMMKDVEYKILEEVKGSTLVGRSYKPLFDYYAGDETLENREKGWKIYAANFVTTDEGTGIVHIAPAFGDEDMQLGKNESLPFIQHVNMNGTFKDEVVDFARASVKPKNDKEKGVDHMQIDIEIVKLLAKKGLLFSKQKIEHSYPHCWRCKTPLLNYAADSWFVKESGIKEKMLKENTKITWVPESIGRARFANLIEGAPDWAISRSRYWGAPLPVWVSDDGEDVEVIGSIEEISERMKSTNTYLVTRHGQAKNNVDEILSSKPDNPHHLTEIGKKQAKKAAKNISDQGGINMIIASPFERTKETAELIAKELGLGKDAVSFDERLREFDFGDLEGKPISDYFSFFSTCAEGFQRTLPHGESFTDIKKRVGELLYEVDGKYSDKRILFVSHDTVIWLLLAAARGADVHGCIAIKGGEEECMKDFIPNAEVRSLEFKPIPHNREYTVDLHRPFIDEATWENEKGKMMRRIPEVFDCWFESGSMPYAQFHYPFENKELFKNNFPADFIAEGLDQTRGWFKSLLVLSTGLFGKSSYKSVIANGIIQAEDGQKMSKSLKNYPDPMIIAQKYGADALRYYLMSSAVVRAEDLNFSEKGVAEVYRKVTVRFLNVLSFYEMYADRKEKDVDPHESDNVLDQWILARLAELEKSVREGYESYQIDRATRPIGDFVDDLSTWYLRRSRGRFKRDDVQDRDFALATTRYALEQFSKIVAPTMPFVADHAYHRIGGALESVHLEDWPNEIRANKKSAQILAEMEEVRAIVSLALEQRASAGLKVRQPLADLSIKESSIKDNEALLDVIADEVNVKEVVVDPALEERCKINTDLTPELITEGKFREFVRNIQDLRKKEGLTPNDIVTAYIDAEGDAKSLIEQFESELKKTSLLKEVRIEPVDEGAEIEVDDFKFVVKFKK